MAEKIELEIVTPKGRALAESVDEVTAPSVQGEFGVLPGHLPVVAALRPGIVSFKQGSEVKRVAVGPGFAEAGQNKLLILAEEYAERVGWGHSCIEDVIDMAAACGVKHTLIGHHDPNRGWTERNWLDESMSRRAETSHVHAEFARAETVFDI